ncbi:hypothetical protein ACH4CC_04915 [Streptomyces lydicus]|uniref:hypothetical protein n=1 Tax=Streptomyces lydicus TaxID=47763 RepID=UPI003795B793
MAAGGLRHQRAAHRSPAVRQPGDGPHLLHSGTSYLLSEHGIAPSVLRDLRAAAADGQFDIDDPELALATVGAEPYGAARSQAGRPVAIFAEQETAGSHGARDGHRAHRAQQLLPGGAGALRRVGAVLDAGPVGPGRSVAALWGRGNGHRRRGQRA